MIEIHQHWQILRLHRLPWKPVICKLMKKLKDVVWPSKSVLIESNHGQFDLGCVLETWWSTKSNLSGHPTDRHVHWTLKAQIIEKESTNMCNVYKNDYKIIHWLKTRKITLLKLTKWISQTTSNEWNNCSINLVRQNILFVVTFIYSKINK